MTDAGEASDRLGIRLRGGLRSRFGKQVKHRSGLTGRG
jgi:hypothetical protein